jgi:hypothetical protein
MREVDKPQISRVARDDKSVAGWISCGATARSPGAEDRDRVCAGASILRKYVLRVHPSADAREALNA